MNLMGVNLIAVIAAAAAAMIVGGVWYSPLLFARPWMIAMGFDPDDKAMIEKAKQGAGKLYGAAFVSSLVTAFVLAQLILALRSEGAAGGAGIGIWVWLGFVATVKLTDALFGHRGFNLFLIDAGYQFVCFVAMGTILGIWR